MIQALTTMTTAELAALTEAIEKEKKNRERTLSRYTNIYRDSPMETLKRDLAAYVTRKPSIDDGLVIEAITAEIARQRMSFV